MLARCKQPTDLSSHWLQQGSAKKEGHVKQKGTQTQQSTCVSGVKHNNPKTGLKIQKKCCCEKKNSWWEVAITWDPNKNLKKSKRRRLLIGYESLKRKEFAVVGGIDAGDVLEKARLRYVALAWRRCKFRGLVFLLTFVASPETKEARSSRRTFGRRQSDVCRVGRQRFDVTE